MGGFFDAPRKRGELEKLEKQISEPDFWNDSEKAQKIVQQRSRIEKALEQQENFETAVSDAEVLIEFAASDENSFKELENLIDRLEKEVSLAETQSLLSGETGGPTLPEPIGYWIYPAFQPLARVLIGVWLLRVAKAGEPR